MTVDPGNITTRTSGPSDLTRPVMTLSVEYVGEPRKGQLSRESNSLDGVKGIDSAPEKSGLIWPKMDEDAPATSKLLNGWTAPDERHDPAEWLSPAVRRHHGQARASTPT